MSDNTLLYQHPNTSCLESFSIKNLFGSKDVSIPFDKETLILIAENGSGKTTILNTLYYLMSSKFGKLSSIEFESISLRFKSGESVEIRKDDLGNVSPFREIEIIDEISRYLPPSEIERLVRVLESDAPRSVIRQRLVNIEKRYEHLLPFPSSYLARLLEEVEYNKKTYRQHRKDTFDQNRKIINKNLNEQILYFPTYRRIEEELKNLGYSEANIDYLEKRDERLIQFGMDDVVNRFDKVKADIKNSIVDSFSKLSGDMLTQLVEGLGRTLEMKEMKESIKPEVLKIVLGRVGDKNISKSDRERIESLVETGELFSRNYEQLIYFLSKLISVYEQQQDRDESIKKFVDVCNRYLKHKQIIYNETTVDISIIETKTGKPIEIRNLSSGEKQIISIFSKMYLDYSNDFILLFDEPELSLSLEWQKMLLPDILNSRKCKFLLAVTHSPFIFDNELDLNARDLDNFVMER